MITVVQILQELQDRHGWSLRRVTKVMGLARSSVLRWKSRLRQGSEAIRSSCCKVALDTSAELDEAIAKLHHGTHRSRGAPALWRLWQGGISRRDFARRVRDHRLQQQREQRDNLQQVVWPHAGAVWAMDPAQYGSIRWNLVGDLASRFRFDLMVASDLPAYRIVMQLRSLFDRYGAPIVLKRDNGSNLVHEMVDRLLDEYGVLALTSPPYYPRYNGAIEYAQREIKSTLDVLTLAGTPLSTALVAAPVLLNTQPRACLDGHTASQTFLNTHHIIQQDFTLKRRKEEKCWIQDHARTIVGDMTKGRNRAYAAAWRQAIETWMLNKGLMKVVQPRNMSPLFT